ncbi:S-methyl-5-thioribose-1-phosphate isomerase [Oricola sp.]|uniref:S-methyl-5-thioribose-1-phosphate isomerase n=1 Tax=Oricola sp. TaxID=1979950 RepID=UPI003BAABDF6
MTNIRQKDQTIWLDPDYPDAVRIIDQRLLPHNYAEMTVGNVETMAVAIKTMAVRGAGCIGVSAGFGMYLAALETKGLGASQADVRLKEAAETLTATRPTATNLSWAVDRQLDGLLNIDDGSARIQTALGIAQDIMDEDIASCHRIGEIGLRLIRELHEKLGRTVNILTHCNAGWLAFVKHGSATAPMYAAQRAGIPIHVFVGESRPRNQGALTAWEMRNAGIDHTYLVDSAIGHVIQRGEVDIIFTGADRVSMSGDVANKIGTYLRALAANENGVPFYVNFPSSTLDPYSFDGIGEIEIEERDSDEVTHIRSEIDGKRVAAPIVSAGTSARNPAFDVTPHRLITGLITERGLCEATPEAVAASFPDYVVRGS